MATTRKDRGWQKAEQKERRNGGAGKGTREEGTREEARGGERRKLRTVFIHPPSRTATAQVAGARRRVEQPGHACVVACRSAIVSWQHSLHGDLARVDDDDLDGGGARARAHGLDGVDDVHAVDHLAEHHVLAVEPRGLRNVCHGEGEGRGGAGGKGRKERKGKRVLNARCVQSDKSDR